MFSARLAVPGRLTGRACVPYPHCYASGKLPDTDALISPETLLGMYTVMTSPTLTTAVTP